MAEPYTSSRDEDLAVLRDRLRQAGVDAATVAGIVDGDPEASGDFERDRDAFAAHWARTDELQARLGGPAGADPAIRDAVLSLRNHACTSRIRFMDAHAATVYAKLTDDRRKLVRVETLVAEAGDVVPRLTPSADVLAREDALKQGEKAGFEMHQGMFLSGLLSIREIGRHMCHAMLLPRAESLELRERFLREGKLDLGRATVERRGAAAVVTLTHPETLNAEDASTLQPLECAADLALMDPETSICVLCGGVVSHSKYAGRRLYGAGINLTGLYWGRVPYMFYIIRDLGFSNKMLRGIARPDRDPREVAGGTREKMWISALEGFAIGGGCQLLLVSDYIVAEAGSYMTLPARKEGIIPGAANMRLARFVGDRIARQAIMYGRRLDADTPEGRLICDEIAPFGEVEAAVDKVVEGLTSSGVVSAEGNRRAMRVTQEPLDMFVDYFATYTREQAYCHVSPALSANLEFHWDAQNRKVA